MRTLRKEDVPMAEQQLQVAEKQEVRPEAGEFTHEGVYFTPAADIWETDEELTVFLDMPGVDRENVEIDLKEETLTVTGKIPKTEEKGEELLTEYRTGNYFRSFRITDAVDRDKISASMSDGVLKLVLPKAAKAKPKKIPISTE
jgi:HSP20 family protein